MSKLHNFPHPEVGHLNILDGAFAGTVTKTFSCLAGEYMLCVAMATDSVSAASTVQVFPYANEAQSAVGGAIDFKADGGTADGTIAVAANTVASVEYSSEIFLPFGAQIVFATTSATGSGSIDFFARTRG